MITVGSVTREEAAKTFGFLAEDFRGRRNAIRDLTHGTPELVFWIHPNGRFHDARTSHRANPPKGFEHILKDGKRPTEDHRWRLVMVSVLT